MTTLNDIPRTTAAMPAITIYGPPKCPNCQKAQDLFERRGVDSTKVTLEPGDENHRYVTDVLGYQSAPVIVVVLAEQTIIHWGGHRLDLIMAIISLCTRGVRAVDPAEPITSEGRGDPQ